MSINKEKGMKSNLIRGNYIVFLIVLAFFLSFRGYEKEKPADSVWLDVSNPKKNINYYLEADSDGNVLMIENLEKKILVRRGTIKKIFFKDFLREIKNSDVVTGQRLSDSKMLFYKGEVISLSAYIDGELRRIDSPLYKFSEAFKYAFNELKKQVYAISPGNPPKAFISCSPLIGKDFDEFKKKVSSDYELKLIETKKLKENVYIFNSINEPYRKFPIEKEEDVSAISDFISENNIFGMKSLFYIGTTRGNFKCSVLTLR